MTETQRTIKIEFSEMSSVVVDPTVLNTRERLTTFLESMICKKYLTILPSFISSSIQKREWDELVRLLRVWEWNLDRAQSEEWFRSADFKRLCHQLNEICVSFERVREELSPEDKELLSKVLEIIGYDSPKVVELAKELIMIAMTKKGGIISYTRHLRRWLKSLRRVLILEISEKTDALSAAKAEVKKRIRKTGRKGRIFVTFVNLTVAVALTTVLPPMINQVMDTIITELGEEVIVCVVTDGI